MVEPRGIGLDRRPLIIIDGRNYKREHCAATQVGEGVARRIAAKRMAFELAMALGELVGVGLIVASIVLFAVALAPHG